MSDILTRGEEPGVYNLAVGEPRFLQNILVIGWDHGLEDYTYPRLGGEEALLRELSRLYDKKYIVVACGARQALLATFCAFKEGYRCQFVAHQAPFWPGYRELAKASGMFFSSHKAMFQDDDQVVRCVTSPNNPDGWQTFNTEVEVWDAVYAHEVYGWDGTTVGKAKVIIGSASKMLGLSGLRVGWLATDDKDLADQAACYIEATTSGVATVSQYHVAKALWHQRMNPQATAERYEQARQILNKNGQLFRQYLGGFVIMPSGPPAYGCGMFAWFTVKEPEQFYKACERARVLVLDGVYCGTTSAEFRMSMGQPNEYTERALEALVKELHV